MVVTTPSRSRLSRCLCCRSCCASRFAFVLFFLSPASQEWQNLQVRPFAQPFVLKKAQGLHCPVACCTEPRLGKPPSEPGAGSTAGGHGHAASAAPADIGAAANCSAIGLTLGLKVGIANGCCRMLGVTIWAATSCLGCCTGLGAKQGGDEPAPSRGSRTPSELL